MSSNTTSQYIPSSGSQSHQEHLLSESETFQGTSMMEMGINDPPVQHIPVMSTQPEPNIVTGVSGAMPFNSMPLSISPRQSNFDVSQSPRLQLQPSVERQYSIGKSMAELSRSGSMQLTGKRKSPPEHTLSGSAYEKPNATNKQVAHLQYRPWLQQFGPVSNQTLHMPTNTLSPRTQHSSIFGKKVTEIESAHQKSGKQPPNKKQHAPPRMKTQDEVNESVRSKMRESLAAALALVQQLDEPPKVKKNSETEETHETTLENTNSTQPVSDAGAHAPIVEGSVSDLPTSAESSVQKDSDGRTLAQDICNNTKIEDVNESDGLKSQYDEVFPRDNVPFTDNIFSSDELLQGNGLSWVLEHVSDLGETKDYEADGGKSIQDPELLASEIEMELFKLFEGVNKKYKEKGRSLLFNLKDKNNPELRERVMSGEISAERLCSMTAEELASKELSQWRQAKAEEMAEMVVLRDTDIDVRSLVRKTHKGEYQVEIDPIENSTVDISVGTASHTKRRPKAKATKTSLKKNELKDKTTKADQSTSSATLSSAEEVDLMQDLSMDDEMKDVEFLAPIVSLDDFMESLDSEPPFESPHGDYEVQASASEKSDSEVGSHSKSPKEESPKELSDKASPKQKQEKIDEVSPKSDTSIKLDDNVSKIEETTSLVDVKGERIWDGILQLSMSSVVPVTGIFKSGEKAKMSEWPAMVEVKGRVRLSGFGKFIQELPKSRSRAVMVMCLTCKDGISESQRDSLFEAIDSYVGDQRVGYAEPTKDVELYLCPPRGEILDLLDKVISKEQLDELKSLDVGLVGVVVWRRPITPSTTGSRHKPGFKRQHSSSSRTSVLHENKKVKENVTINKQPLSDNRASVSMGNHGFRNDASRYDDIDDDDVPPGFGPGVLKDDDDLPEFNFNSATGPVSSSPRPVPQSRSIDQARTLIHKYGNSGVSSSNNLGVHSWHHKNNDDDDDNDDIPEWQPNVVSHQFQPQAPAPAGPPGFRPEMGLQGHNRTVVRPGGTQDGWWANQDGSGQQHYGVSHDRNRSRNRGF